MYIYAVFFSPIFEELVCRRFLQDKLNKHIQSYVSIILVALLFATLHFNLTNFVGYFFVGIVWGYYYQKTNNIFVPIMSHFMFNYFAILAQSL
ncbi:lysostaphin resistance A-like protein [Paenibacillus sp. JSM ZJ436]|uniref:lysostaphin resistance A-like protein n=1 Tax=Paenibacillus sp. JSM ZJ436 TaxID=3376190 RepID=UPI0037889BFA